MYRGTHLSTSCVLMSCDTDVWKKGCIECLGISMAGGGEVWMGADDFRMCWFIEASKTRALSAFMVQKGADI